MAPPIPVIVCDDSSLARKQMLKAISRWDLEITQASNGLEALDAIKAGRGHLVFLDLNMPIMDGYAVLEHVRRHDLPCMIIVVSGDVQEDARQRVMAMGAIGFVAKPFTPESIYSALAAYGLLSELQPRQNELPKTASLPQDPDQQLADMAREVANIAMGRAGALLSKLLGVFIPLPVPKSGVIQLSELEMALAYAQGEDPISSISQGFIGPRLSGEAILMFRDSALPQLASLLDYPTPLSVEHEREMLMDLANVLTGAFILNFGRLLGLEFSLDAPHLLAQHGQAPDLQMPTQRRALAIEIDYRLNSTQLTCELLILFTDDSLSELHTRLEQLNR
ncbi:response regulator [Nitrincola tapanii]|nr:response regulator [Nitrincola tapanii]